MEEENKVMQEKVIEQVEKSINEITESGVTPTNLDNLGKLIDIHKDIKYEEYMKAKEEDFMRYGNYGRGSYGRDEYGEVYNTYGRRSRDSRGRYTEGSYGRRYRGHDMLDEMYGNYENYNMGHEEYNRSGNYGAKEDTMKSLESMMMATYDFVCMLKEEAQSPEEMEIIKKYSRKISEL